jgi:hypothetical protein
LAAVIFFSWWDKQSTVHRRVAGRRYSSRVFEQRESYHTNAKKGRKNRAIPLIWRHFFNPPKWQAIQPFVTVVLYAEYSLGG